MSILAVGYIQEIAQNVNDASKFDVHIICQAADGTRRDINGDFWISVMDPNASGADLRTQCEAAIKTEASKQLGVVFGPLDGARLLVGALGV